MNVATSMHRIDVIYLNDKGESLAEGEPHQSYTCITLQRRSESWRKHTTSRMDKHLNSNVQVINHCQYARGEEFNTALEECKQNGIFVISTFFSSSHSALKMLNSFSFKCKSAAQAEFCFLIWIHIERMWPTINQKTMGVYADTNTNTNLDKSNK